MAKIDSTSTINKFDAVIKNKDNVILGKMILEGLHKKISITKLTELAKTHNSTALQKALQASHTLHKMHKAASDVHLLVTALYIETELHKHTAKNENYLTSDKTGLPLRIERDPVTQRTFIHTTHAISKAGALKQVTLSYEYNHQNPLLIANSTANGTGGRESANFKRMKDAKCVIQARAITHRVDANGHNKVAFLTELYQPGALTLKAFKKLTLKERLKVAQDILTGVNEIHKKDCIHRDLKPLNVFLNKENDKVKAIVGDLGQVHELAEVKGKRPNATAYYNPPEAFVSESKVKKINYQQAEMFSAGCIFYELLYQKQVPWIASKYFPKNFEGLEKDTKSFFKEGMKGQAQQVRKMIRYELIEKSKKSKEVIFKRLIAKLLHEDPKKRPTAQEALKMLSS